MSTLRIDGRTIEIGNEDKVFFSDDGITKGDVVDYFRRIAGRMIPFLEHRPLAMRRFPDGIETGGFYQKEIPGHFPEWVDTVTLDKVEGGTVTHVVCNDAATLVYLADQGAIELHTLLARTDRPHRPDQLIIDLDPSTDDPTDVVSGARAVRSLLDDLDVTSFVKSTGSRGVHVLVNLDASSDFDTTRDLARALADAVVAREPDLLTTATSKSKRGDRVFVDWLRNSYGQHAVAPYSVRALPGAPVAVPLDWSEATSSSFDPRRYTLVNVFRRLGQKTDPWAGADRHVYSPAAVRERLDELT